MSMYRRPHLYMFIWGGVPARPNRLINLLLLTILNWKIQSDVLFLKADMCTVIMHAWFHLHRFVCFYTVPCIFFSPQFNIHETEDDAISLTFLSAQCLQNRTSDAQVIGIGGRPKLRKPWIPPGRLSCRRDVGSNQCQVSLHLTLQCLHPELLSIPANKYNWEEEEDHKIVIAVAVLQQRAYNRAIIKYKNMSQQSF